jgi:hypothetical protein
MSGLYCSNIDHLLPEMPMRPAFSVSSLVSVFLVDLVMEIDPEALRRYLPVLLHTAFMVLIVSHIQSSKIGSLFNLLTLVHCLSLI